MENKKLINDLSIIFILATLSVLEASFLINYHSANIVLQAVATLSPLSGHAWWLAFQNRLLSAAILSSFHAGNIEKSYEIFIYIFTLICNLFVFVLFSKNGSKKALIYTFIFALAFLLFQDNTWLYGWDFINVLVTILVLIGIDNKSPITYFVLLYVAALFNHESALYIPAWLFLSYLPHDKKKAIYSLLLLLAGAILIFYLRLILFKGSCRSYIGMDLNHRIGNHFYLLKNISHPFIKYMGDKYFDLVPTVVLAAHIYSLRYWKNKKLRDVLIYSGIMLTAGFIFGNIHETRIWLPIIPALLYLNKDILFT